MSACPVTAGPPSRTAAPATAAPRRRHTGIRSSFLVVALLASGVTLGACSGGSADLDGRTFTSTEVRGHDLVEGSQVTLSFQDGRISAQAGCNTVGGAATWDDGTLEVEEPLASTMMACEDALLAQDEWLASFLTSSPSLDADGGTLTLTDDSTEITLEEQE